MKKEIKLIDKEKKVVRITTLNERWYAKPSTDSKTGLPIFEYFPSSTLIASYYPKGIFFYKWLAEKGWDEAEAIKNAAGDKGSKVHIACGHIDEGLEIDIEKSKYLNNSTEQMEELSQEELDCILSYVKFIDDLKPVLLANEITSFGKFYAGTADKIFAVPNSVYPDVRQIWIVDLKTSKSIWEEYKLQISSYSHMDIDYKKLGITDVEWENRKLAILQVGYTRNKDGYKFTEIDDKFDLFEMAYKIFLNENPDSKPQQKDYPLIIKSNFRTLKVENSISKIKPKKHETKSNN